MGSGECPACPHCERADLGVDGTAVRFKNVLVSDRPKFEFSRGEPMRVTSVPVGGSLAGKLSSRLSSILSSTSQQPAVAAGACAAQPRTDAAAGAMDRGIMSPAKFLAQPRMRQEHAAHAPSSCSYTPPARAGTRFATPSGLSRWPKPIPRFQRIEVNALSVG